MKQLAEFLEVTPRRVTSLVDADGLVERYPHPTDGRSTIVAITGAGLEQQREGWQQHQDKVAVAFGDLSAEDQERLLEISRKLTQVFRTRLAARFNAIDPHACPRSAPRAALPQRAASADGCLSPDRAALVGCWLGYLVTATIPAPKAPNRRRAGKSPSNGEGLRSSSAPSGDTRKPSPVPPAGCPLGRLTIGGSFQAGGHWARPRSSGIRLGCGPQGRALR